MTSSIPSIPLQTLDRFIPSLPPLRPYHHFAGQLYGFRHKENQKRLKTSVYRYLFFVFNFENVRLQNVSILQSTTCTNHLQAVLTRKSACRKQVFRTKQQMIIPDGISSCHTGPRKPSSVGYLNAPTPEISSPENFSICPFTPSQPCIHAGFSVKDTLHRSFTGWFTA